MKFNNLLSTTTLTAWQISYNDVVMTKNIHEWLLQKRLIILTIIDFKII